MNADQQVEALRQERLGEHGAAEEQRHADRHEADAVAPLLLVRPGATNAHSWYSQTGLARKSPAIAQIFSAKVNGSPMSPKLSVRPGRSCLVWSNDGTSSVEELVVEERRR